jgi:hypothetical protein
MVQGWSQPNQPPINIISDMHADPLPQNLSYNDKAAFYAMQLDYGNWALDQTDPLGAEISFLAGGEFMEFVVQEGSGGAGSLFLQRIYAGGGQIGSHSHDEYRRGAFDWPPCLPPYTIAESVRSWQDNITWVDYAIVKALGFPTPEPLAAINSAKGAHLPQTEPEYHALMAHFRMNVREGGPEEDWYGIYNHHIMNPYRPSRTNCMSEDLTAPFAAVPQGPVIGRAEVHHGVFQDMTAPNVKRMFIQIYLNWRYRDRHGLPEKVWCFGWAAHNRDFEPGSPTCTDFSEMLSWLDANFVGKVSPTGSTIARWSSQRKTAEEYFAWESAHPGTSSFDSNGTHLDWNDYPYLRALCAELWEAHHVNDLDLGSGIIAWHLARGPGDIVAAFSDSGPVQVDLSGIVNSPCRVVAAETGLLVGTDPAAVVVDSEPVIVTGFAPVVSLSGTPGIGQTVQITISGQPDAEGLLFMSPSPASISVPHVGRLLIDPGAGIMNLGGGTMTGGSFTLPFTIPNDPGLVGKILYVQGLERTDIAHTLTINALDVTIR